MRNDHDRELIHRLLDGDLAADERDELLRRIKADPDLAREYEALNGPVQMLAADGRREAPPGFTEAVMRRIPERKPSLGERLHGFLFGARVLRWNMATAMAGLLLVTAALLLTQLRDGGRTALPTAATEGPATVRLSFYAPQARQVAVAGDFNKWSVGSNLMERRDGGIWTIDLTLQPGRYTYMFVLDGTAWVADPGADSYQDDGFGSTNAVMKVSI
jgi:anti-sigma-K factor RskA